MLSILNKREAEVITGLYEDGLTQAEVAEVLNLCRQRVQQIAARAILKLKEERNFHVEFISD